MPSIDAILAKFTVGDVIPSKSGRKTYQILAILPGESVTLGHPGREPSTLPWSNIEIVYRAVMSKPLKTLTPKEVDELLKHHPATRCASTMCALVLAMVK
jgi:hypothetical protein